jgi:hypothetical protein
VWDRALKYCVENKIMNTLKNIKKENNETEIKAKNKSMGAKNQKIKKFGEENKRLFLCYLHKCAVQKARTPRKPNSSSIRK